MQRQKCRLYNFVICITTNTMTDKTTKHVKRQTDTYDSPASARSSALSRSASTMANLRATYRSPEKKLKLAKHVFRRATKKFGIL